MKLIITICLLLLLQTGFAQLNNFTRPDFKTIEAAIKDKNSPLFYSKLMERYKNNDTTLTNEEYRYLYYGYSFQTEYSPYGRPSQSDAIKKSIADKDDVKTIELEKKVLKEYPFNLRNLYTLVNTLDVKGDTAEATIYYKKMLGVAKAIMSTGDGQTDTTAMYVISVDHEYDMIGLLGYKTGGSQSLINGKYGSMDKLAIGKNDEGIEYLYFNVDRLFAKMMNLFDKEKN